MATLTIHNVDPALKAEAMEIMRQHGMTAKDTISAFLYKIVTDHRKDADACFCRDLELSDETRQDLEDAKAGRVNYTASKNTDELFKRLGI